MRRLALALAAVLALAACGGGEDLTTADTTPSPTATPDGGDLTAPVEDGTEAPGTGGTDGTDGTGGTDSGEAGIELSELPTDACEAAFADVTREDVLERGGDALVPALTACASVPDFEAAAAQAGGVLGDVDPAEFLGNLCEDAGIGEEPICQEVRPQL
jgi:hypothetical protein